MDKCFSGYINNSEMLRRSASGGFATAFAMKVIEEKGVVYGVTYSSDFKSVTWIRIDTVFNIKKIQGSKYIKADTSGINFEGSVYSAVIKDLCDDRSVLFTGLPCEVAALLSMIKKQDIEDKKLITLDLICQGPGQPCIQKDYIELQEKKFGSKTTGFSARFKNPDWNNISLKMNFENGQIYLEKLSKTEYWKAVCRVPQKSCFDCRFKGINHQADITIGDHWGIESNNSLYNPMGVSIAITHTEKGERFLHTTHLIKAEQIKLEDALAANPRYSIPIEDSAEKARFNMLYKKFGLKKACKWYNNYLAIAMFVIYKKTFGKKS